MHVMAKPLFTGPEVMAFDNGQADPYGSEQGRETGAAVMHMIADALRRSPEDRRVRAVAECFRLFPRETSRHPDVNEYLTYLARHGETAALKRILGDRQRRGRPARTGDEVFARVAVLDGITEREGCSVRRAAEIAREEHPHLFEHMSIRGIENDFSANHDAVRLSSRPRWVPGEKLADAPWQPPERRRR